MWRKLNIPKSVICLRNEPDRFWIPTKARWRLKTGNINSEIVNNDRNHNPKLNVVLYKVKTSVLSLVSFPVMTVTQITHQLLIRFLRWPCTHTTRLRRFRPFCNGDMFPRHNERALIWSIELVVMSAGWRVRKALSNNCTDLDRIDVRRRILLNIFGFSYSISEPKYLEEPTINITTSSPVVL